MAAADAAVAAEEDAEAARAADEGGEHEVATEVEDAEDGADEGVPPKSWARTDSSQQPSKTGTVPRREQQPISTERTSA